MAFETDIERMYRAGRELIPQAAARLTKTTGRFHDLLDAFDQQAALAGDPSVLRAMLQVGGDTYDVLRGGIKNLYHCADAVCDTAYYFRTNDEDARDDFNKMTARIKQGKEDPLPPPAHQPTLPPPADHPEHPGHGNTPSTPDPEDPDQERGERDRGDVDPTHRWGR